MRTIWKYTLPTPMEADSHVVDMPRGARVLRLAFQHGQPTMWVEVDDQAPLLPRRFQTFGTGHDLGEFTAAGYAGSYEQGPFVWHVFEAQHADRLPARIAALPLEAQNAYRVLRKAGYVLDIVAGQWTAPDDEPMTTEVLLASAELSEHGLGVFDE